MLHMYLTKDSEILFSRVNVCTGSNAVSVWDVMKGVINDNDLKMCAKVSDHFTVDF